MNKPVGAVQWRGVGLTHGGRVRSSNQDCFGIDERLGLWVVADGMGGRAGGNIASKLAVEAVLSHVRRAGAETPPTSGEDCQRILEEAILAGDDAIRQTVADRPHLDGMGTTVVVMWVSPGSTDAVTIGHVGDSRAYLLRHGNLTRLTRDHSLVEELVTQGGLTPEQAEVHPQRNVLTRAVGIKEVAKPEFATVSLETEDLVLLCTDGLSRMLDDEEIRRTIMEAGPDKEGQCRALVDAANHKGGKDNITVLMVGRT